MPDNVHAIDFKRFRISCEDCSLSELCLPRGLNTGDLDKLEEIVRRSSPVQPGEYIFKAGDRLSNIYAVRSGTIKMYIVDESGDEQIIGFYFPGEILGLDAIETQIHQVSAVAIETSTYCGFSYDKVSEVSHAVPELQNQLINLMSRQLTAECKLLLTIGKKNAEEKLAIFLLSLSARFQKLGYSATEFKLSMSRQDIANYLGLTIETVSRIMSRFQRQGIVAVEKKMLKILDRDILHELATGCQGGRQN